MSISAHTHDNGGGCELKAGMQKGCIARIAADGGGVRSRYRSIIDDKGKTTLENQ